MTIADIYSEIRKLCDTDSTGYVDADILRRLNAAYEQTVGDLIAADGPWDFDDTNYTDLPIATITMVASQQDYSFSTSQLDIQRVEVLTNTNIWQPLHPIDKSQIHFALTEYQKTAGLPYEYDKQGGSIFLYPAPSATYTTLASGLKVYFKRSASTFTQGDVTTGTIQPGFASPYHILLAYMVALPYCMSYKKDRVALYQSEVARLHTAMIQFYAHREEDVPDIMRMKGIRHR